MYLLDTNILIYYLSGSYTTHQKDFIDEAFQDSFNISAITKIELLGWQKHTDITYRNAVNFLSNAKVISIDDILVDKTIEIKRKYKIKLGDAIIAATAILNELTLVSRNKTDFNNLKKLNVINPFDFTDIQIFQ